MRMLASILLTLTLALLQVARVAAEDTSSDSDDSSEEDDDDDDDDEEGEDDQQAAKGDTKDGDAAQAPVEPAAWSRPISLGLLLGYGFDLSNSDGYWGLGLGLRGGYNIGQIYLGGRLVYHFGSSRDEIALGRVIREHATHHIDVGFEGGYELLLMDRLTVRPELGLGLVNLTTYFKNTTQEMTDSQLALYFALGATVTYDLTPTFFLGGDSRLMIVVGTAATEAFTFLAHGGWRF